MNIKLFFEPLSRDLCRIMLGCAALSIMQAGPALAASTDTPTQPSTSRPVALPDTQEFSLQDANGKPYRIFVAVPPGEPSAQGYGTLTILDGNAYFATAAEAMRMVQTFPEFVQDGAKQQAQPVLVVGVAYPGDALFDGPRRSWDFLPPARNPEHIERLRGAEPGGADAFLAFLTETLRPALAARWPLRNDLHTLAGHSLGGYFTLHALASQPAAFQRYAAISPSTWWDDLRIATDLAQAPASQARVLLEVAEDEWPGYPDYSTVMRDGARAVRDTLTRKGLDADTLRYREIPGADHMTTPVTSMPDIVRFATRP